MKKEMLWKRQKACSPQELHLSRSVRHEKVWLRFVDFKYYFPLPNPDLPSLREKFQIPEQIPLFLCVFLLGFSGT